MLADRTGEPATFLILGSASPELSRQAAESLAGRVEIIEMRGFDLGELPADAPAKLWQRGGFPRSYLAADEESSVVWRKNFIGTFLERDLGALGFGPLAGQIRRPKVEGRNKSEPRSASGFVFRISVLGLLSAFGLRTSKPTAPGAEG